MPKKMKETKTRMFLKTLEVTIHLQEKMTEIQNIIGKDVEPHSCWY